MANAEKWLNRRTDKPLVEEHPATKWLKRRVENEDEQPEYSESKGFSGIASDALSKAIQAPFGFIQGLKQLPSETMGAGRQFLTDYPRYAQNIGAGFGQLGHGILSAPGATRDYLARKELIPQETPSFRLPESVLPRDFNYAEALGAHGKQAGDELIRSLPLQVAMAPLVNKALSVAGEIPLTKGVGGKKLNAVRQGLNERGVNKLRIDKDIIKDAKQYLPKDTPSKKLLARASTGDYDALFTLQSDLRKRGSSLQKSFSGAERNHGFDAQQLRQRLLNGMKADIRSQGHGDLADLLHLGQKRYAQHMKYRPYAIGLGAMAVGHSPIEKLIKKLIL